MVLWLTLRRVCCGAAAWPSCGLTPQRRIILCLDGDQSRLLFRTPPREDVFVIFCIGRELSKSRLPDSPVLQQLIQRQQIITACSGRYKEAGTWTRTKSEKKLRGQVIDMCGYLLRVSDG